MLFLRHRRVALSTRFEPASPRLRPAACSGDRPRSCKRSRAIRRLRGRRTGHLLRCTFMYAQEGASREQICDLRVTGTGHSRAPPKTLVTCAPFIGGHIRAPDLCPRDRKWLSAEEHIVRDMIQSCKLQGEYRGLACKLKP